MHVGDDDDDDFVACSSSPLSLGLALFPSLFPRTFHYSQCIQTISISFISPFLQATATNATTVECVLKGQASNSRANVPMDGEVASAASTSMNARVRRVSTVEFVSTKLQAMRARAQKSTPDQTAKRT